jgi:cell division protein FtsZ
MQELGRHVRDHTQILFGTAVDGRMGKRLSVTIISSLASDVENVAPPQRVATEAAPPPKPALPPPIWEQPQPEIQEATEIQPEPAMAESAPAPEDVVPLEPPVSLEDPIPPAPEIKKAEAAPRLIMPKKKPLPVNEVAPPMSPPPPSSEKVVQAKQEVMQFEPVTRGRFEKSEPTIVEGQDLDVPTYLRKNIRVK